MMQAGRMAWHGGAIVAALTIMAMTACSGEAENKAATAGPAGAAAPPAQTPKAAAPDSAENRPARTMTKSDRLTLEMADRACQSEDFSTFFRAYSGSWAVRERHTSAMVQFGVTGQSRAMPRRQYLDQNLYPLAPMDNAYATADSVQRFDGKVGASWRDLTYVELEFNTASDNRRRIDWLPGIFEMHLTPPPPELEEGLGKLVQQTGDGGTLLFRPTASCWELAEDIQNPPYQP